MEKLALEVLGWLQEAKEDIVRHLKDPLVVDTKSSFNDLVTNMDKKTQDFLVGKILDKFPEDKILAEENGMNELASLKGRVWIIDPIDGTLNFVLQQKNFCIMLGLFVDGKSELGFIYNVMADELYWGGKSLGIYCNQDKLEKPKDKKINEGLLGMNAYLYGNNIQHAHDIGNLSMGVRMTGCAGLEMISILKGEQVGYLSNLQPWDYAPGCALLDAFDIPYGTMEGKKLSFSGREPFLALQPTAFSEVKEKFFLNK